MTDEELLQKYPNGPRNLEEAIAIVKDSDTMKASIETAVGIATLANLGMVKGLFTEEEYNEMHDKCELEVVKGIAEKLLKTFEGNK